MLTPLSLYPPKELYFLMWTIAQRQEPHQSKQTTYVISVSTLTTTKKLFLFFLPSEGDAWLPVQLSSQPHLRLHVDLVKNGDAPNLVLNRSNGSFSLPFTSTYLQSPKHKFQSTVSHPVSPQTSPSPTISVFPLPSFHDLTRIPNHYFPLKPNNCFTAFPSLEIYSSAQKENCPILIITGRQNSYVRTSVFLGYNIPDSTVLQPKRQNTKKWIREWNDYLPYKLLSQITTQNVFYEKKKIELVLD